MTAAATGKDEGTRVTPDTAGLGGALPLAIGEKTSLDDSSAGPPQSLSKAINLANTSIILANCGSGLRSFAKDGIWQVGHAPVSASALFPHSLQDVHRRVVTEGGGAGMQTDSEREDVADADQTGFNDNT